MNNKCAVGKRSVRSSHYRHELGSGYDSWSFSNAPRSLWPRDWIIRLCRQVWATWSIVNFVMTQGPQYAEGAEESTTRTEHRKAVLLRTRDGPVSNLCPATGCSDNCSPFSSAPTRKFRESTSVTSRPLPSTSSPVHYSPFMLPFGTL
jgi:hypothetical protein